MSSPTKRTLDKLRRDGWTLVEVVERWNPFAKIRHDLFGFVDVIAIRGDITLAVQTTSAANVSARFHKMQLLPSVTHWLSSESRQVLIHGWARRGPRGKAKRWECRELNVVLGPTGSPVLMEQSQ